MKIINAIRINHTCTHTQTGMPIYQESDNTEMPVFPV